MLSVETLVFARSLLRLKRPWSDRQKLGTGQCSILNTSPEAAWQ